MPNADAEENGVGTPRQQAFGGGQVFGVYLVVAGVDVQDEELAPVVLLHLCPYLMVIQRLAALPDLLPCLGSS